MIQKVCFQRTFPLSNHNSHLYTEEAVSAAEIMAQQSSGGGGGGGGGGGSSAAAPSLAEGIVYAHVSSAQQKPTVKEADKVGDGASLDLESLMAQLKGVQK